MSKKSEVKLPYKQVKAFFKIPHSMYIFPTALNDILKINEFKIIMSPKSHSTEIRTLLMDLLNSSIWGVIPAVRYGTTR